MLLLSLTWSNADSVGSLGRRWLHTLLSGCPVHDGEDSAARLAKDTKCNNTVTIRAAIIELRNGTTDEAEILDP